MFSDPVKNLRALGLREDYIVADLGAGTGFYSVAAGHIVTRGKVYAVEVQKDYLETIKNKAKEVFLHNVEIIWGNIEKLGGSKIGDEIVHAVIASNVFSQLEVKDIFVDEVKRILKPRGQVLFVDLMPDSIISSRGAVAKAKVRELFEKKGFVFGRDIDVGAHHYGMILTKQ